METEPGKDFLGKNDRAVLPTCQKYTTKASSVRVNARGSSVSRNYWALFQSEDEKTASGRCVAEVRVMRCPKCGSAMMFVGEI